MTLRKLGLLLVCGSTLSLVSAVEDSATSTPPPFFLQDPTDSLCLAGETFKRCSIETLFYVVGSPGSYRIHKRPLDGSVEAEDDGMCISKKSCKPADKTKVQEAKLAKCSHCGAKSWNILGDADSGYVLTEGDGTETCLFREKDGVKAQTGPCETVTYTPLQLQFASATDIATMSSPGARLIGAASDGDKKAVQALLKEGIDVNARDWDDLTALVPAASGGNLDLVKFLIKEGIDVNAKDKDGITALMEASIMGHVKVVDFLLDKGAQVDTPASSLVTALWLAASEGKVECMKSLVKKGADASNARVDGITALMTASAGGHLDAVKFLIDKGAEITATDTEGSTALMNAAETGNLELVKLLLSKAGDADHVNAKAKSGFNALIIASANGHSKIVEELLTAGTDANAVADNDVTALMYAAAGNHVETIQTLVASGKVDLEFKHTNGGTAVMEAATSGSADALKALMEAGAEIDYFDSDHVSPLMAIASQGSLEGQTMLLDKFKTTKSDAELKDYINLYSASGGSSVMFAAAGGHADCAKALMDLGADIKAISKATPEYLVKLEDMIATGQVDKDADPHVDGVTALHVAAQGGHLDMVKLLIENGADVTVLDEQGRSALSLAIKGNYGESASELVQAGADPNMVYTDDDGKDHNLLFDAIMVENEDFAKLLIEKNADIYYQDEKKVSTLLQASHRGLSEIVGMLLEKHSSGKKGDYVELASDEGVTPLIAASSEGHLPVIKLLLAADVNVNSKDKEDTTALMAAAARGNLEIVSELIKAKASLNHQNKDGHTALMFAYNGKNQVETLWERYSQFLTESKTDEASPDDGGTGPIIREALDNHTALVDLLLKSGADSTLKDKEGHTAKDFDFHPDADGDLKDMGKAEKIQDPSKDEL